MSSFKILFNLVKMCLIRAEIISAKYFSDTWTGSTSPITSTWKTSSPTDGYKLLHSWTSSLLNNFPKSSATLNIFSNNHTFLVNVVNWSSWFRTEATVAFRPPPKSITVAQTRSPSFNTDLIITDGEIMMFSTCKPARSTVYRMEDSSRTNIQETTHFKRIPIIPRGSRIPWKPSTELFTRVKVMTSTVWSHTL